MWSYRQGATFNVENWASSKQIVQIFYCTNCIHTSKQILALLTLFPNHVFPNCYCHKSSKGYGKCPTISNGRTFCPTKCFSSHSPNFWRGYKIELGGALAPSIPFLKIEPNNKCLTKPPSPPIKQYVNPEH